MNIMEFCKAFNAVTDKQRGFKIPVEITVYQDRSFTFITKEPAGVHSADQGRRYREGLSVPSKDKVAKLTRTSSRISPRRR